MPARASALRQAFVDTCVIGSPRYEKTNFGSFPSNSFSTASASLLGGTPIPFLPFASLALTQATDRSRSMLSQRNFATSA